MSRQPIRCLILVICLFFVTGCWDRRELNELAIELGLGLDQAKNNDIQVSTQFIIPSKIKTGQGGGDEKGRTFFVETGTGMNTLEAIQRMQTKLSREVFRGHRRVIVIGEQLARRGLAPLIDTYSRDPEIRLRADALIVKGNTAKRLLESSYPLENTSAVGALKEHNITGIGDKTFLNFLIAATSDGITPTLPAIALTQDQTSVKVQIVGVAIFNKDLKLIGFLDMKEGNIYDWMGNRLKKQTISLKLPKEKGNISFDVTKMDSKVKPIFRGHTIKFDIVLSGEGSIQENNTDLDLTQLGNITILEHVLDKQTETQALQTIEKVQKQYKTDIFGFGEVIHQKYPYQWIGLRKNWDKEFSKIQVSVHANLTIRRVGLTGPPLHLKENKINK